MTKRKKNIDLYTYFCFVFQLQNSKRNRVLCPLCRQLPGADLDEGQGQGVPALRQVRVPAQEVVHARHRLHIQSLDKV